MAARYVRTEGNHQTSPVYRNKASLWPLNRGLNHDPRWSPSLRLRVRRRRRDPGTGLTPQNSGSGSPLWLWADAYPFPSPRAVSPLAGCSTDLLEPTSVGRRRGARDL